MIELFLKAVDRLMNLIRIGEKRAKARYDEIYKPTFAELQTVHSDYLAFLSEFRVRVEKIPNGATHGDSAAADALTFLTERRLTLDPVRVKLWAFRDMLEDNAASGLPQIEKDFLRSLVRYFEATEIIQNENTTYATDLLDKLKSALTPTLPNLKENEVEGGFGDDDYPTYSLSKVRTECDITLKWLDESWGEAVVNFNKLRLDVAHHAS